MREELERKVAYSIKLLQVDCKGKKVELAYSGGKDSDVILQLAKESSPSNVLHFEAGAQWADEHPKNVWHDPEEEPLDAKDLLLIDNKAHVWVGFVSHTKGSPAWKTYVHDGKVAKWAYVEELLPKIDE